MSNDNKWFAQWDNVFIAIEIDIKNVQQLLCMVYGLITTKY